MQLILTIENGPQPEMSGKTWRCGTEGGTLGRNPKCDLVLPDPKRYTSSIHALIEFDRDGFTLTDRSTNGTYHNSPKTLIGKNRSVSLDRNDKIYIGDFVLRVEVEDAEDSASPAAPGSSGTSPLEQTDSDFYRDDDDLDVGSDSESDSESESDVDVDVDSEFDSSIDSDFNDAPPESHAAGSSEHSRPWDNSEFSAPWDGEGTEPDSEEGSGKSKGDRSSSDRDDDRSFSQSPEREYFAAPSTSPSGGEAIPEDWDDFLTGFHDLSKMHKPDDAPATDADSMSQADPDRASRRKNKAAEADDNPFADADPDPEERFEPPSTPAPSADAPADEGNASGPLARDTTPPAAGDQSEPTSPEQSVDKARPSGAAKRSGNARSRATPPPASTVNSASEAQAHDILQVVTRGLMGLLQGRAEIKNEFRIAQTRFVQTENNPLKFSPDADEALKRILADEQSPGFLTGARAFEDAFDDIQAHQLAILSAVQRAIESAVAQFDPAQIEKKLERISPMSSKMPGLKAAKCWNLYSVHYEEVAAKMRDDARQLFLTEFAEAYEEACRAVAQNRREDES